MALQRYSHTGGAPATGLASSINSSVTTFSILSATGYPTGSSGYFVLVLDPGTASEEKVLCSGISGTSVTVVGGGRGYDNTVAAAHNSGTLNVQHVWSAAEADDASRHIYGNLPGPTLSDDHTNYALANGGRSATCLVIMDPPQAIPANSMTVIQFNDTVVDTDSGFNTGTYTYTVPHAATYQVHAQVTLPAAASTLSLAVYHNGSFVATGNGGSVATDALSGNSYVTATVLRNQACSANDTLEIQGTSLNGGTVPTDSARCYLEIVEVH